MTDTIKDAAEALGARGLRMVVCPGCNKEMAWDNTPIGLCNQCEQGAEADTLRSELAEAREVLREEKRRRVYYQNIAYDVALFLERGESPRDKIIVGTVDEPSTEVQEQVRAMLALQGAEDRGRR